MAWGEREEVWIVRLERFHGDPDLPDVWERARATLTEWQHEGGAPLHDPLVHGRLRATSRTPCSHS
jgi:phage terminase large subunit GpA-like protein